MKKIETHLLINAPITAVWSAITDFESYPLWNSYYPFIRGKKGAGNSITVKIKPPKMMGIRLTAIIDSFAPNRLFSWKASILFKGLFERSFEISLVVKDDHTTLLTQKTTFRGILVSLLGFIIEKSAEGIKQMNQQLKSICENPIAYTSIPFTNWGGTVSYTAEKMLFPKDIPELSHIFQAAFQTGKKVKLIGSGHSFSEILCSVDPHTWIIKLNYFNQIDFSGMKPVNDGSKQLYSIEVGGGVILEDLIEQLGAKKFRLLNVGSITEQTISGALSTNTHGSGIKHGGFVSFVQSISIVNGNGVYIKDITSGDQPELFYSVCCGIGLVGVITSVRILIAKNNQSEVDARFIPFSDLSDQQNLNKLLESNEIFEGFWYPYINTVYACKKNIVDAPNSGDIPAWGLKAAYIYGNIIYKSRISLIKKVIFLDKWLIPFFFRIDKLVTPPLHFVRPKNQDSIEDFQKDSWKEMYDCEIFFNYQYAAEILSSLNDMLDAGLKKRDYYCEFPIHVRFMRGDEAYLSQGYEGKEKDKVFTSLCIPGVPDDDKKNVYTAIANKVQEIILKHDPNERYRFHLGKNLPPDFEYPDFLKNNPGLPKWLQVREANDPHNLFINHPWMTKVLGIPYEITISSTVMKQAMTDINSI